MADNHRREFLALMAASPFQIDSPSREEAKLGLIVLPDILALAQAPIPVTGTVAVVGGYHQRGDGGGGSFVWESDARERADRGAVIMPSAAKENGPGRWHRLIQSPAMNIRWWGAHEGVRNNAPSINAAIAFAARSGGGEVVGQGTFPTTEPINVPDLVTFRGAGRMTLIIVPQGSFNCIQVHGESYKTWGNQRSVIGIAIDGRDLRGNGLDIRNCGLRCYFADLLIQNCQGVGLRIEGSFDHKYERIECRGNTGFGIEVMEKQLALDGVYEEVSRLRFDHVDAVSNDRGGVQWNQAGGDNCEWIGCKASEGLVGIRFSRNGCKHTLLDIHCDGIANDTSILEIDSPWAQDITVISVRGWRTKYRVYVRRGRNINIRDASDIAPLTNGSDVFVATTADGEVRVGPNVTFTDTRTSPKTYPEDAQKAWNPIDSEVDRLHEFSEMRANYSQNGHLVAFWIKFAVLKTGNRTFKPQLLALPTEQANDSIGLFSFSRKDGKSISSVVTIKSHAIAFPDDFLAVTQRHDFEWLQGDEIRVSGTYTVP
jgi:hypothetical protein